jgi:hypothetical protein
MGFYNTSYGYGIKIDDILNCNEDAFRNLIKKQNLYDELDLDEDASELDCKDAIDDYENSYGEKGLAAVLSDITLDEGIELRAITDCNGYQYLVILQLFPWQYCEKTRKLTCDEVNDYINKLLSDVTEEEIEIKTWEIEESFG